MPDCTFCGKHSPAGVARCPDCGGEFSVLTTDSEPADEVVRLVQQGQRIAAIALYRERTGVGLLEAKNAIEAMEHDVLASSSTHENEFEREVLILLTQGKKVPAIKLWRQRTGQGLKESKEAVEAIAVRNGLPQKSGCLAVLVVLIPAAWWLTRLG